MDASPSHPAPGDAAERLHRLEQLFHQALTYPPSERGTQARALCQNDPELLAELLALLNSDASVENLLHASPSTVDPQAYLLRNNAPNGGATTHQDPWLNRILGPFRVERILGRGGMGVVYLGHRIAQDFHQTVAIKVIARHLRSSPAVSQFLLERETLAQLQHPNIARLLDGGVYEGVPYVVMEYVDGRRIDTVCDDPATSTDTTIRLILQLCEAVDYVHRNLILHRDLKPGNVMVTAEGVVKLLDFGTLKLIAATNASSDMTQAGMRSVTLRYASPEHIRGEAVSTASDLYSLGMMLYRLLAGHLPEGMDNLTISEYLDDLKTANVTPPCTGKAIPRRLAKDLDAIVLKAIRYEPEARYSSVNALAADLSNALADEPVAAREGNLRYRTGKFYRHRRTAILGTAAVLTVLAAGLAEVAHQGRIARAQTHRAEAGVESERKLTHLLLSDYFEQLQEIPGSTDAQHKAVTQAVTYLDDLTKVAAGSPRLQLDSIQAYTRLGNLQGNLYQQNLGDTTGALASLDKAVALSRNLKSAAPNDLAVLNAFALAQKSRSEVLFGSDRTPEAVVSMRSAIASYDTLTANAADDPAQLIEASSAYSGFGDQLGGPGLPNLGDYQGALTAYRTSIQLAQRALAINPGNPAAMRRVATGHSKVGDILVLTDPVRAIDEYHQSLAGFNALPAADKTRASTRSRLAIISDRLGSALTEAGDYKPAIAIFEQVADINRAAAAADPKDMRALYNVTLPLSLEALAYIYMLDPALNPQQEDREANIRQAVALVRSLLSIYQRLVAVNAKNPMFKIDLAYTQVVLATLQQHLGETAAPTVTEMAATGIDTLRQDASAPDAPSEVLENVTSAMLQILPTSLRDPHLTVQYAERLVTLDHRRNPNYLLLLAQAYDQDNQPQRARATATEALALLPPVPPGGTIVRARKLLEQEAQQRK